MATLDWPRAGPRWFFDTSQKENHAAGNEQRTSIHEMSPLWQVARKIFVIIQTAAGENFSLFGQHSYRVEDVHRHLDQQHLVRIRDETLSPQNHITHQVLLPPPSGRQQCLTACSHRRQTWTAHDSAAAVAANRMHYYYQDSHERKRRKNPLWWWETQCFD